MEQSQRTATLDAFRAGTIQLLAASDVAAHGLDIPDVSHVFNLDVPWAGDDYIHRIGRTGRAGREGRSLSLVSPDDLKLLKDIEKQTGEQPSWIAAAPRPRRLRELEEAPSRSRWPSRRPGCRTAWRRWTGPRPPAGARPRARTPASSARHGSGRRGRNNRWRRGVSCRPTVPPDVRRVVSARSAANGQSGRPRLPISPRSCRGRRPTSTSKCSLAPIASRATSGSVSRGRSRPANRDRQSEPRPSVNGNRSSSANAGRTINNHVHQQHARPERPQRDRRPPREDRDDRGAPTGFADNVPAFLRRPVKAKAAND